MSEQEIDQINVKLRYISDDIYYQENKIRKHERAGEQIVELNQQNNKLFDELFSYWHQEPEMHHFLMDEHDHFQHEKYKLQEILENEQETLMKEKQQLIEQEESFYSQRRELSLKGGNS